MDSSKFSKQFQYYSSAFSLESAQNDTCAYVKMQMHSPIVNTRRLSHTLPFFRKWFPQVLNTACFNEHNYSFTKEIAQTEIGHLLEHLVLAHLLEETTKRGRTTSVFNGITDWNWEKDRWGLFHIKVDVGIHDAPLFYEALLKSIHLVEKLLTLHSKAVN